MGQLGAGILLAAAVLGFWLYLGLCAIASALETMHKGMNWNVNVHHHHEANAVQMETTVER